VTEAGPESEQDTNMLSMTRSLVAAQRDASRRVAEARKFSVRLPLIGAVRVPPPDQLAFYAVLGGLAALELIDWPLAVAMGIGSAVLSRHLTDLERREANVEAAVSGAPAPPAPAKKAPARAPAKQAPAKQTPAKKAPVKKAVKKAPAKKAAKKAPPAKRI
jgi:cation-transporting P-type ATPase I